MYMCMHTLTHTTVVDCMHGCHSPQISRQLVPKNSVVVTESTLMFSAHLDLILGTFKRYAPDDLRGLFF